MGNACSSDAAPGDAGAVNVNVPRSSKGGAGGGAAGASVRAPMAGLSLRTGPAQKRGAIGQTQSTAPGVGDDAIAKSLPKYPAKTDVAKGLILMAIENNILFRDLKDKESQRLLTDCMAPLTVAPGADVVVQGDSNATKFYVVHSGAFTAIVNGQPVATYGPGGAFGELALLYSAPRAATIRATAPGSLWVLEAGHYRTVARMAIMEERRAKEAIVWGVPLFKTLTKEQRELVVDSLLPGSYEAGSKIVREGDQGNEIFLLAAGEVVCSKGGRELARIGPGRFFGELALINDEVRAADVTAVSFVKVFTLGRAAFSNIMAQIAENFICGALATVPLLHSLGRTQLLSLAQLMEVQELDDGAAVYRRGEPSTTLYLIDDGSVRVGNGPNARILQRGAVFGEATMIGGEPQNHDAQAASPCRLLTLSRAALSGTVGSLADMRSAFRSQALRRVPILKDLDPALLMDIAAELQQRTFAAGETIIRQGEEGHEFYVVESGIAVITDAKGCQVARKKAGEYFGEVALLTAELRQANVSAASNGCVVLALGRPAFERLTAASKRVGNALQATKLTYTPVAFQLRVTLKDLEIKRALGCGTFGKVYLARYRGRNFALKQIGKAQVVEKGLVQHVKRERDVMLECNCPFVVNLVGSFQDDQHLYLMMETVMGGELFYYLQAHRQPLSEPHARFYVACVCLAFEFLHQRYFVYRDLKPENLLLHTNGYIKVADFSFVKRVRVGKTYTLCGTPAYLAPEQISRSGHDQGVDWWAVGVLLFEMLTGTSPFYHADDMTMFRKIVDVKYSFSQNSRVSYEAKDLVTSLLQKQSHRRLPMQRGGIPGLLNHDFFHNFNWEALRAGRMVAPYVPQLKDESDCRFFVDCENENPGEGFGAYTSIGTFSDF